MKSSLILLAAGKSSRMGMPKGLVSFKNQTLLEFQIKRFAEAGGEYAFLILEKDQTQYHDFFKIIDDQFEIAGIKITIITNDHTEWGPFYSLQLGLKSCGENALMTPIDSPLPSSGLINKIIETTQLVALPLYQNKKGHPVFISMKFSSTLQKLSPNESRLDHILRDLDQLELIETEEQEVLLNLNTPSDLKAKAN